MTVVVGVVVVDNVVVPEVVSVVVWVVKHGNNCRCDLTAITLLLSLWALPG